MKFDLSNPGEVWKNIDYPDYFISNQGRVISVKYNKVKLIALHLTRVKGYVRFGVCDNGNMYSKRVHRLVGKYFKPNPVNLPELNHLDGNKLNNNDWNLEWSTHADNMEHASKTKLLRCGSQHKDSVLKETDIPIIKKLFSEQNVSQRQIAKQFGVSHTTIRFIINGYKWKTA